MDEINNRAPNAAPRRPRHRAPTAALRLFNARAPRENSATRRQIFQALIDFPEDVVGSDVVLRGRNRILALKAFCRLMSKAWRRTENKLDFKTQQCTVLQQLVENATSQLDHFTRKKALLLNHLRETLRVSAQIRDELGSLRDQLAQLRTNNENSSRELDGLFEVNLGLTADNVHFYHELYKHSLEAERLRKRSGLGYIWQVCYHYFFQIIDHFIGPY